MKRLIFVVDFFFGCLNGTYALFVPFYWSFSAIALSVILRITASEYHFGFCKLFGKKLLRAYVVLFYYVTNQNKVFLFLFLSYTKKNDQHESHKISGINSGDPEGFSVEGNNCFIIQKLL
jgi:hypothetical protein